MQKMECPCGYVYDPEEGDPDNGVAAGIGAGAQVRSVGIPIAEIVRGLENHLEIGWCESRVVDGLDEPVVVPCAARVVVLALLDAVVRDDGQKGRGHQLGIHLLDDLVARDLRVEDVTHLCLEGGEDGVEVLVGLRGPGGGTEASAGGGVHLDAGGREDPLPVQLPGGGDRAASQGQARSARWGTRSAEPA